MTRPKSSILVASAKCQRGKKLKKKKNHYFHSLNMPICLFFYFIALVIAINPTWSIFFPLFMIVTFQSQVSTQSTRQAYNTYPETLLTNPTNVPLRMDPQRLPGLEILCHFAIQRPFERKPLSFWCMVLTTFFLLYSKNWSCLI